MVWTRDFSEHTREDDMSALLSNMLLLLARKLSKQRSSRIQPPPQVLESEVYESKPAIL